MLLKLTEQSGWDVCDGFCYTNLEEKRSKAFMSLERDTLQGNKSYIREL